MHIWELFYLPNDLKYYPSMSEIYYMVKHLCRPKKLDLLYNQMSVDPTPN